MEAQKRLELLKRQREELINRQKRDLEGKAALSLKGARGGHVESAEIPQLRQRQEHRRLALSVGTMCVPEEIRERVKANADDASEESAEEISASSSDESVERKPAVRLLSSDEANEFIRQMPAFVHALRAFESRLNAELRRRASLIEDYIYRGDADGREQHGGYAVRRYPDADFRGKFAANDVAFFGNCSGEEGSERLAVAYALASGGEPLPGGYEHALGIYIAERRAATKHCRNEVKRIVASPHEQLIVGGLDSGKIAIWDARSRRSLPEINTKLSSKSNYLPIIDLHAREYFVYCVGLEGRICKWDMRSFEEPIVTHDLYCENDHITRLEAMPLGMLADPREEELFHINTAEGSVYTVSLAGDVGEQRSAHLSIHAAPIVRLQCCDALGFFASKNCNSPTLSNFFLSASLDWNIKIFRNDFQGEEAKIGFHREFVTALQSNPRLNPFAFASADANGKVAVWRLDQSGWSLPLYQWDATAAIHQLAWSPNGCELAAVDAKGGLHVLSFPRKKLAMSDKAIETYLSNGLNLSFNA